MSLPTRGKIRRRPGLCCRRWSLVEASNATWATAAQPLPIPRRWRRSASFSETQHQKSRIATPAALGDSPMPDLSCPLRARITWLDRRGGAWIQRGAPTPRLNSERESMENHGLARPPACRCYHPPQHRRRGSPQFLRSLSPHK